MLSLSPMPQASAATSNPRAPPMSPPQSFIGGQHQLVALKAPRQVAEFLFQLTRMLTDPTNHNLIEWDAGKIVVHDPRRMESEVLSKYFRHSKYSSFQRQLNYFGFHKISGKGKMSPCSYVNDATTEDLSCILSIKRKSASKGNKDAAASAIASSGAASKSKGKKNSKKRSSVKKSDGKAAKIPKKANDPPTTPSLVSSAADVKAKDYGVPGTRSSDLPAETAAVTPTSSAPSSTTDLVDLCARQAQRQHQQQSQSQPQRPAHTHPGQDLFAREQLCMGPAFSVDAAAVTHNFHTYGSAQQATLALETSFRKALAADSSSRSSGCIPSALSKDNNNHDITALTTFSIPKPLSVPNPLSYQLGVPQPQAVTLNKHTLPSPATAAMQDASNSMSSDDFHQASPDLSSGFPQFPPISGPKAAQQGSYAAQQQPSMAQLLSNSLPSSNTLFPSHRLPSCNSLSGSAGTSMLSPNSSLVDLAMLPTM